MAQDRDLQLLSLAGLAHRCARESDRFFRRQSHDPRYCFELFRRAFLHRNERAWELVYAQYRPLVSGWVKRHPSFPLSGEEVDYYVNRGFEKMWSAVTPEKFERFANLKSLLSYLQMCVHSAVVDHARATEQATYDESLEELTDTTQAPGPSVEARTLAGVKRETLWNAIEERLNDDDERLVVHCSYVLGLKPRQIYARFDDKFDDVTDIYRIKQNVLDRFRRDSELKEYLTEHA